ncbi:MAG: hypothetical protein A2284_06085 [Deltaproteobacteria bacterium RIFOXYA12_FULL_61_11]|nr:MAG: hypothetical protein A2284_06085 [Deltaproteobacteria bacterium RIFOXYA12_FULL_61_11]
MKVVVLLLTAILVAEAAIAVERQWEIRIRPVTMIPTADMCTAVSDAYNTQLASSIEQGILQDNQVLFEVRCVPAKLIIGLRHPKRHDLELLFTLHTGENQFEDFEAIIDAVNAVSVHGLHEVLQSRIYSLKDVTLLKERG